MSNINDNICGIIPVNKPQGWTSFDVVAKLRGILHIKKIGHSGTLDPMATGVLPVFVGKATRACDIIPIDSKSYLAGFKMGVSTDTQDITGNVLETGDKLPSFEEIKEAASCFLGDIMQLPPMYSAVKVDGKKLYQLARQGKTVERTPKPRRVEKITVREYNNATGEGVLYAEVSKGTYVRTLINDIGEKLGCGGCMTSLERLSAAGFVKAQCYTLQQIQTIVDEGKLSQIIIPVSSVFTAFYDELTLGERAAAMYKNGVKLHGKQAGIKIAALANGVTFIVCDSEDNFLGLARYSAETDELLSVRNFY